jgi:aminopeptidase N
MTTVTILTQATFPFLKLILLPVNIKRPYIKHSCIVIMLMCLEHTCIAQTVLQKSQLGKENMPSNTLPERKWWNVLHYAIDVTPNYNKKFITGTNSITFRTLQSGRVMQIDLQQPMDITKIIWLNKQLKFSRHGNAYLVSFPKALNKNETLTITVHFKGYPNVANKPPWDNGWIFTADKKGRPWMSIACEGSGARIWLPCKDVLYDEPDNGTSFSITVPDTLVAVANGRLLKRIKNNNGTTTYRWNVASPINNYNIIPYIGKYVTWHHDFPGQKGNLDCDFWVLDYNLEKAKKHFQQVDTMLRCFEYWLGPYPFYKDSYKVVDAPMAGMEHQSAIAYGNAFENGYSGKNLSGTVWGLQWDFILVHESGHEWFGNSITASNDGESWIHEGFTKYLETIYTNYVFGTEAGNDYTIGIWKRILNDAPVIGSGSSDQYNKGCAMLHMIRQIIGDSTFRELLHGLNKTFYHQTVSTEQILLFMNHYAQKDFTKMFDQYLRTTKVPILEYSLKHSVFNFRWTNCIDSFNMPLKVSFNSEPEIFIFPTTEWQNISIPATELKTLTVDRNFYVQAKDRNLE